MSRQIIGRVANKVTVITGAARGMGRATAERFAQEGAKLVLNDRDQAPLDELVQTLNANGANAIGVAGDVASEADIKRLMQEAVSTFGSIDILVANAGIIPEADLASATADLWDHTWRLMGGVCFYLANMLR